jgi:hypothetical protein
MTPDWLCCSLSLKQNHSKLLRVPAKYRVEQSLISYFRCRGSCVAWVRVSRPIAECFAQTSCLLGCHVLALDLVRSWSFDRPTMPTQNRQVVDITEALDDRLQELDQSQPPSPVRERGERSASRSRPPPSPTMRKKSIQLMRRQSLLIDMDIPSLPPTRSASPAPPIRTQLDGVDRNLPEVERGRASATPDHDLVARQTGLGTLMKSAKKDVTVPEFDMSNFF